MARLVSFSLDGTWKRARTSSNYSGKAASAGYDYNNIIYTIVYPVIKTDNNVIYLIRRKKKE